MFCIHPYSILSKLLYDVLHIDWYLSSFPQLSSCLVLMLLPSTATFTCCRRLLPSPAAFTCCFHLLPSHGAVACCLHLVPSPAAFTCCRHPLPSPSAFTRCRHMVPSPAAFTCCRHPLPSPSAFTRCHHLLPLPAAFTCCRHLLPSPAAVTCCVTWRYHLVVQVRVMHVSINGLTVSPPAGFLIRRAPGNCHFDFVQEIIFSQSYDDKKDSR